ncbi:MAG: alpha/beta fold hydrolase [Actinomycetota bacterium]|nr:alpha/beta fold hydrolase [Actinomycetota bacterium]
MEELVATSVGDVSVVVDGTVTDDVLILAHGAGAGMHHPFMERVAHSLAAGDIAVARFNFVYAQQGRKAPDRQAILEETYSAVVDRVRSRLSPRRLFLGGKSMGGRIATHLSATGETCDGVVLLGYPLHPPGRPERIRDAHLYELNVPILLVEGTRDPFCPLVTLERVRSKMKAPTSLLVIEGGDHAFNVRRSSGRTTDDALAELVAGVRCWIAELPGVTGA